MENIGRTPITEAEARNLSIDYVEIESISNGWIKGHYRTVGRLSIDADFMHNLMRMAHLNFLMKASVQSLQVTTMECRITI